jgi:hypothetical protein
MMRANVPAAGGQILPGRAGAIRGVRVSEWEMAAGWQGSLMLMCRPGMS